MTCIEFQGHTSSTGYGKKYHKGRMILAHRLAYAEANGLDVFELDGVVMHKCDNPPCINPDHLIMGTKADNSKDMVEKGRQAKGDAHWKSKLTSEIVAFCRESYVPRHKIYGVRALAIRFNVAPSVMSCAIQGKSWEA